MPVTRPDAISRQQMFKVRTIAIQTCFDDKAIMYFVFSFLYIVFHRAPLQTCFNNEAIMYLIFHFLYIFLTKIQNKDVCFEEKVSLSSNRKMQ